jgi:peptide/nickel transport system substrate-binding protein
MKARIVLAFVLSIALVGCGTKKEGKSGSTPRSTVVVAIEGDIDSFNPLFAEDITAGEINDLLFPALVSSDFDRDSGELRYSPMLAQSWEYSNEHRDITFHLISNARWTDGKPVTARDVQLTFELYGDPDVASVRQASVENLRHTNGNVDLTKSIEVKDDSTVAFHFAKAYPGQLFDVGLPILPAHILETIPRKDLRTDLFNKSPIGFGPFSLAKWTPLQETILQSNPHSVVPYPAKLLQLVFRVIPDYRTRLAQLESGEIDLVGGLRPDDADKLSKEVPTIEITSTPGRDYDFLGWNNVDPETYVASKGKAIRPHKLFGSSSVRRAITLAINRKELVDAYLGRHGHVAFGGISPLFKWAYNDSLKPLPFDPQQARALLEKEGWKDTDGDGILDKHGIRFSFVLKVPAGNQLRNVVAAAVQQQLKQVKIDMRIEQIERGTFWQEVTTRKYDAWLAGFSVPLQMQLDDLWGSDLAKYPFNLTGFRNARVDKILATARTLRSEIDGAALWKEFQEIVHEQQPCTFLYWINNIVAVDKRVHGTRIGVLGTAHHAWEWYVDAGGAVASASLR